MQITSVVVVVAAVSRSHQRGYFIVIDNVSHERLLQPMSVLQFADWIRPDWRLCHGNVLRTHPHIRPVFPQEFTPTVAP
jgi:hypothetical protein